MANLSIKDREVGGVTVLDLDGKITIGEGSVLLREGEPVPAIYLLRKAGPVAAEKVRAVLADRGFDRVSADEIVRLAREHGALDEARARAEEQADAARRELAVFERSPYREALAVLPDFILARDH